MIAILSQVQHVLPLMVMLLYLLRVKRFPVLPNLGNTTKVQSNLDYPDFSIIRTFSPVQFFHEY